jgi:hypothetical protein
MIQSVHKYVARVRLSPVKSIRLYCKTVCAGSPKETRLCPVSECPLHSFRQGKQPSRSGVGGGQRGQRGRFLPRSVVPEGDNPIISPREGLDVDKTASIDSGSNMNGSRGSIEVSQGEVRIEKTSSGLLIRLTQVPQHRQQRII